MSWASALPAELRVHVSEAMGPSATITEWIRFEQDCSTDGVDFTPLFKAWLRSRDHNSTFCSSEWDDEEISFVRRYIAGMRC